MGLIHSRAAKKKNKAQAELMKEEAKTVKAERKAAGRGEPHRADAAQAAAEAGPVPWYREPTVGSLLKNHGARK